MSDEKPEKTFTQAQLDAIVKERLKKKNAEVAELKQQLSERPNTQDLAAAEKALQDLKDAHASDLNVRDQQMSEFKTKLESLEQGIAERELALHRERTANAFGEALDRNNLYSPARRDALRVLMDELTEVVRDKDGRMLANWRELHQQPPDQIAHAFLRDRPHFTQGTFGGSGHRVPPNAGIRESTRQMDKMSPHELFDAAGADPSPSPRSAES